jgi:hypothetical protein
MDGPSQVPNFLYPAYFSLVCEIRCHTAHVSRVLCRQQHRTSAESKVQHNLTSKFCFIKNISCWEQKDLLSSKKLEQPKDRIHLQITHISFTIFNITWTSSLQHHMDRIGGIMEGDRPHSLTNNTHQLHNLQYHMDF